MMRIFYLLFAVLIGLWCMYLPYQAGLEKEQQKQEAQFEDNAQSPFLLTLNNTYRELLHEHILSNSCIDLLNVSLKQQEICNQQHEIHSLQLQLARDRIERMYYFDISFDDVGIDVLELFQEEVGKLNRNDSINSVSPSPPDEELGVGPSTASRL